jgi:hypothetical protein
VIKVACPLEQYHEYEEYLNMMNEKGFTDAEALALLPQDELAKDMKTDKEHTRVIKAAINSDDTNTKKTAIDAIASWGVDEVVSLGLKDDVGVKAAFDQLGIDISKIDVSWDDVSLDDATKVAAYVTAGHPKAIAYVDAVIQDALKTNSTSTDKLAAILLLDILGKGGMTSTFGTTSPIGKIKNIDQMMRVYDDYYNDVNNIDINKLEVGKTTQGVAITWTDGFGKERSQLMMDNQGNVWNPQTKKFENTTADKEGNSFIQEVMQIDKYTKITLNPEQYAKAVLDYLTGIKSTTDKETRESLWAIFVEQISNYNSLMWTCTGSGCLSGGNESSGGGGGGGGGSSGSGSGDKDLTENTLLVDTGAVTDVSIYANDELIGTCNTAITLDTGNYVIKATKDGYETVTFALLLGNYPVTKQVDMKKIANKINAFIKGIGGLEKLTNEHIFFVYCALKETNTSESEWRTLPKSLSPAITTMIERPTKYDVQYLRYMIEGEYTKAKLLVDEGKVTL